MVGLNDETVALHGRQVVGATSNLIHHLLDIFKLYDFYTSSDALYSCISQVFSSRLGRILKKKGY